LQHASLTAWDPSRASDPPHFPLHNFFFIRDLHRLYLPRIYSRRNETLRRAPDGQTGTCERVGWDAEKGKRARDWQKYRTRNVSLTAGYSEDRGKWRAERPGSDTRRHSSEEWSSGTGGSGQLRLAGLRNTAGPERDKQ
jgi:hypothetical protein